VGWNSSTHVKDKIISNILVRQPVRKISLSRHRKMWEDNIKKNLITWNPSPVKVFRESCLGNCLYDVYFICNAIRLAYPPNFSAAKVHIVVLCFMMGTRGSVVGRGTILQAGRSRVRVPMMWIFFNLPHLSSSIMPLGSTQPLTEMRTRNLPGG
jgi:hypothetical protein